MKSQKELFKKKKFLKNRLATWVQLILGSSSHLWFTYVILTYKNDHSSLLNSPYSSQISCYILFKCY